MDLQTEGCYGCAGFGHGDTCSACTQRSYTWQLTSGRHHQHPINEISDDPERGMWITCWDETGMEVELVIKGLTLGKIKEWMAS